MSEFRDYASAGEAVRENYRLARQNQTHQFAQGMVEKYKQRPKRKLEIWSALDQLSQFVDLSDPDLTLPNLHHLFQTAEGIRRDGHPHWFQLTGLIHDLGKIQYLWGTSEEGTSLTQQWAIVGDTFLTGCELPSNIIYPEFNSLHPDNYVKGIYSKSRIRSVRLFLGT